MGLITEEVEVVLSGKNYNWYENKGYILPREKDRYGRIRVPKHSKIFVQVIHLMDSTKTKVKIECDECKIIKEWCWSDYIIQVKADGKCYCNNCAKKLYANKNIKKTRLKNSESFSYWCIKNLPLREAVNIIARWDYELNNISPNEVSYGTLDSFYFKCNKQIHNSELKIIGSFIKNKKQSLDCNQCGSFEKWCVENNRQDILDRWDYELNIELPIEIPKGRRKYFWFKCPRKIHDSERNNINSLTSCSQETFYCKKCNSFAQWGIDNICSDFLEKYWDYEKNDELGLDPWNIAKRSNKKVFIKCQEKEYHESYLVSTSSFVAGARCSYCVKRKVHPKDSLGQYIIDSFGKKFLSSVWGNKNNETPFTYSPGGDSSVWWKCPNNIHKDFKRRIATSKSLDFRCPQCEFSKGETLINNYLIQNKIANTTQKTYEGLLGLGGGLLSYDFYLPSYNLLVEYQGEYHDGNLTGNNKTFFNLEKQQEHDRRKREYAEKNNINLLEIWYWDYDNIEEILTKTLSELSGKTRE